ncbi:MAG TPA: O-antigen ligase family protein [Thermoanaerobaculia bacterium]|nr:O-antigen ligase family protein [Thermoanaerobaculia bacterium]
MRRPPRPHLIPAPNESRLAAVEWLVLATGMLLIPLWISPAGRDPFRMPKLLLLRGEGIVLLALAAASLLLHGRAKNAGPGSAFSSAVLIAIGAWTVITSLTSHDLPMSAPSVLTVLAGISVFMAARGAAARPAALWIVLPAPLIIAALAIVETKDSWNRSINTILIGGIADDMIARVSPVSLLGNRNDVGNFLVAPALCAMAMFCVAGRPRSRAMALAVLVVLAGGIVVSNTITAIAAFAAAVIPLAFLRSRKEGLAALLLVAVAATAAVTASAPLRQRLAALRQAVERRAWDDLLTRRLVAFLAAGEMIQRNPLTGIGPGLFRKEYFDHRIIAAEKHLGTLDDGGSPDVFEEAHNDHLQVAAESGLPGYALFVMAMAGLARLSWRAPPSAEIVRLLAAPLAISLFVLALAQSPLRLAVTIGTYSYLAGICAGRSGRDAH